MFQIFSHSLKKKKIQDFGLLFHWQQKKVVFPCTFLLHQQKSTPLLKLTNLYQYLWFIPHSLSLFLFPFYVFLVFLSIWSSNLINALLISISKKSLSICSNFNKLPTYIVKKSYTSKVKTYINYYFFSSEFHIYY